VMSMYLWDGPETFGVRWVGASNTAGTGCG
jgi:hypothetical protein